MYPEVSGENPSAPVLGIPVDQSRIPASVKQNTTVRNLPVVSEGFCVPHEVVFTLQSNTNPRSTELYNVVDSAGDQQFRVFVVNDSGSALDIVDKQGQVVLTLKSKTFSAHNKWYIFSGNSTNKQDKIATVKPQEDSMNAEVYLKGRARRHADTEERPSNADFIMAGNRSVTYSKITHQEDGYSTPVAELNKITPPAIKQGAPVPNRIDVYSLHTLPGIDSVFMLAITIALDESILSPQQMQPYGGLGGMGYGTRGMGYGMGGVGYGMGGMGYGLGGMGYGAPMLLGAGLGMGMLGGSMMGGGMMGGFW